MYLVLDEEVYERDDGTEEERRKDLAIPIPGCCRGGGRTFDGTELPRYRQDQIAAPGKINLNS